MDAVEEMDTVKPRLSQMDLERAARRRVNEATRRTVLAARRVVSARGGAHALKFLATALAELENAEHALRDAERRP